MKKITTIMILITSTLMLATIFVYLMTKPDKNTGEEFVDTVLSGAESESTIASAAFNATKRSVGQITGEKRKDDHNDIDSQSYKADIYDTLHDRSNQYQLPDELKQIYSSLPPWYQSVTQYLGIYYPDLLQTYEKIGRLSYDGETYVMISQKSGRGEDTYFLYHLTMTDDGQWIVDQNIDFEVGEKIIADGKDALEKRDPETKKLW